MSTEVKQILEAALFSACEPVPLKRLQELFEGEGPALEDIRLALIELASDYASRAVNLVEVAGGWRFQVTQRFAPWVLRLRMEKAPRYSRALLETLAIIAYRQPLTRGDVEAIRGVSVSTQIVRTLMDRGWIRIVGHRDVPGRPALYSTTRDFLDYFNLQSLGDLPSLAELKQLHETEQDEATQANATTSSAP